MPHPLRLVLLVVATLALTHMSGQAPTWLDSLIHSLPTYRQHIAQAPEGFELQVLYRPLSGRDSNVTLRSGVDPARYFYPASTVKLPVAALALEWVAEQDIDGLNSDTPFFVGASEPPQTPSTERIGVGGVPTLAGHVRDIAVVSSNEAYNRMFELLGARAINESLYRRGWPTRVVHRVGVSGYSPAANQRLNPVSFRSRDTDSLLYSRDARTSVTPYPIVKDDEHKGQGYYVDSLEQTLDGPFDFSRKNFVALEDLADILQAVVAPETVDSMQRFRMREADRAMLVEALRTRPADSDNPLHHDKPDGYVNFLYYGGDGLWEDDGPVIYNKVGDAYGTLTDVAIFEDPVTRRRCVLAATIHVNANGIYNDGEYEYETIGLPFLRELGRAVWDRR